jgi:hypothetical protein
MHSISTSTFLGSVLTATQLRAGLWENHFSYSAFISCLAGLAQLSHLSSAKTGIQFGLTAKRPMSERKMVVLTTLERLEPASSRTAWAFLQTWAVFSPMVPSISVPSGVRGIWPEQ